MSRRKEIALLLSLGASTKEVKHIFLRLGIIIGYTGILFGIPSDCRKAVRAVIKQVLKVEGWR